MDGELKELHCVKNQLECREYGAGALAVGIGNQFNSYASTTYLYHNGIFKSVKTAVSS